jgi:hypothetical protein
MVRVDLSIICLVPIRYFFKNKIMSSKFIPKSRIKAPVFNAEWTSFLEKDDSNYISFSSRKQNEEEERQYQEERNFLKLEKERIEAIPLNELTFKDLYQFPFHQAKYGDWVYDLNSNFMFQFENVEKETRQKFIDILNNEITEYNRQDVTGKDGDIFIDGKHFITIRGWGNLTGCGAYNLDGDYAAKIQDTLLEYIVNKIKK